ncbi:PAS domain-containing protein [Comamonas aquatica]|nr:PAS domain-containing protein [Comamonas aquatica]
MLSQLIGKNLRDLLDSIGSPACVVEVIEKNKFFFLMANSLFEDAFNLQNFSYVGRKLQDVYLGERATQLEKLLKQCIDKNITIESVESLVFGNTTNHWRFNFRPIKDAKENISRVFVAATNVSRLVELENQLKYEHLLLQVQSDMTPDGVLVVSKKGDYLSWNEKFKAIFVFPKNTCCLGRLL